MLLKFAEHGSYDSSRQYGAEAGSELRFPEHDAYARAAMITAEQRAEDALIFARTTALARVDSGFEQAAEALVAGYPAAERLTWPQQQAEALAWEADSSAPTPFLDSLAVGREVSPEAMRALTLGAVRAFLGASPALVGKRQRLRDEALAAATIAQLEAINW